MEERHEKVGAGGVENPPFERRPGDPPPPPEQSEAPPEQSDDAPAQFETESEMNHKRGVAADEATDVPEVASPAAGRATDVPEVASPAAGRATDVPEVASPTAGRATDEWDASVTGAAASGHPAMVSTTAARSPRIRPGVSPVVVPRWIQAVVLPLAILGAFLLLRAAGPVALIFIVAALVALLLNPFVAMLQRRRFPRGVAVLCVYLGLIATLVAIGAVLADPIGDQASRFSNAVPGIVDDANAELADLQEWLDDKGIDVEVAKQGETALETLGARVTEGSGELVSFTREALTTIIEGSIAVIVTVVLSIYMLLYGERIGAAVRAFAPPGDGTRADDYPIRVQRAVFGYVRGQLLFSVIMGTSAGVALWVMGWLGVFPDGKTYAIVFGAFYGFAELIPYVGPAIGAAPPVLIALFSDNSIDALWLTIMFTALQQIEGHIVAPTVFAQALRINPLLVIFALLMGGRLYGIAGAFLALPLAAVVRETVVYAREHLVLEPWGTPTAEQLGHHALPPNDPGTARRCAECGTPAPADAAYCGACGTELGPADEAAAAASGAPS